MIEMSNEWKGEEKIDEKQKEMSLFQRIRTSFISFIIIFTIFAYTHGVHGHYPNSILTTLEKRFNFPSLLIGIVMTICTIGYVISCTFITFFLPKKFQIKIFPICMLLTSLSALLYGLPHFIFPNVSSKDLLVQNSSLHKNLIEVEFCSENDLILNLSSSSDSLFLPTKPETSNIAAFFMFCVAEVLQGLAGGPLWTIGFTIIDDYTSPSLASKLGIIFFMRFVSQVTAFNMGAFFLSFPDHLRETTLTPKDPEWIGAWWMGFMFCAVINFIISIPAFCLAEKLRKIKSIKSENLSHLGFFQYSQLA